MAAPSPRTPKKRYLPTVIGLIGIFVVVILGTLACLLFALRMPVRRATRPTAIPTSPALSLPTASPPTATPGPPTPEIVGYTAEEPITGFSNCNSYGFWGVVSSRNGDGQSDVQIVVWEKRAGLVALSSTDAEGNYRIEINEQPAQRRLWVQVYQNDLPVSLPVSVETQIDCQNGFQIYQIDWRQVDQ